MKTSRQPRLSFISIAVAVLVFFSARSDGQQSPIAGRNVNMVSGTTYPGGDPFLQRQNEVAIAASTRNAQHLFAGANDYRSVDLASVGDPFISRPTIADAWLGVFKSMDGGSSWKSVLLPGYPRDPSPEGKASPINIYTTASDAIVRSGTNGMFYYGGIAFNRDDQSKGVLFVARYIDNNNKETGDSIVYINTKVVASGSSGRFVDKPWMAVDVPRNGAGTCSIQTTQKDGQVVRQINQSFAAGNVYVAYTEFVGNVNNVNSRIMFSRSTDCGATWSNPIRLTEGAPIYQGSTIAIDPLSGDVYVAWREIAEYTSEGTLKSPDTIWVAKSTNYGATFSSPIQVVQFSPQTPPFDQTTLGTSNGARQFRTRAFPTMAVDASHRVYVAWSQKGVGADGGGRIAVKTSTNGLNWSGTPTVLTDSPPSPRGHQVMPSLTFAAGRLMLTYYDFREDWAFLPPPAGQSASGAANIADPIITSSGPYLQDPDPTKNSGRPYLHTMEVRAAQADPSDQPLFVSTRVSKYLYRKVFTPGQAPQLVQLEANAPNYALFDQGSKPFIGDYIDIAGPPFVFVNGAWQWNIAPSNSSTFHTAWADNRDVRPPVDYDWTKYTAPGAVAGAPSVWDPAIPQPQQCVPDRTGMRDQNIYTSRLTQGLSVTVPGNSKPLGQFQRAYVVYVQNTARPNYGNPLTSVKYFRLTIQQPLPVGTIASFLQFRPQDSIDVAILARSSVARSVFVTSNNPDAVVKVKVEEIAAIGGGVVSGGLTDTAVINPDILNPDILNPDILNPDILNPGVPNPDILNAEVYNPDILNQVQITSIQNPDILNPDILNPDILNPDILNPDILNPDILNPDILNPDILNPDILNPDILNPDILNPDILNPDILNPAIAEVKDIVWTVYNAGNTTAAYTFKNFANRNTEDFAFQLLVYKTYATTSQQDCAVKPRMHQELVVNVLNPDILNPDILNPDILNPDILNATFYLSPYEGAKVALRVIDKDKTDNKRITVNGQPIPPATPGVPQVFPIESIQIDGADVNAAVIAQEVNTEDAARGITTPPSATARLTIITQELPSGRVGQPYSAELKADAGTPPYTWSLLFGQGATPGSIGASGLTLSPNGSITGTPVSAGTFSFSVQVTDTAARTDRRDLAIAVAPALTPGTGNLVVVSQPNPCFDTLNPQPTCAMVNEVIVPATSVKAFSDTGASVAGVPVTLSKASGPGTLGGTLTRTTNSNGVAAFDDLTLSQSGAYRFAAAAAGYTSAATGDFNVIGTVFIIPVTNTANSGPGSLRQAMLDANGRPPTESVFIVFNIPGAGPHTIAVTSQLPTMTRPVSIDATTQPSYSGQPVVMLDVASAGAGANGFTITGGSTQIRGFVISGFDRDGIVLQTGGGNRISRNYIGTNLNGTAPYGAGNTGKRGILVQDSSNNIIGGADGTTPGGPCTGDCNVLVARGAGPGDPVPAAGSGVYIVGSGGSTNGNQVLGNYLGVDVTGTVGIGGLYSFGVSIFNDGAVAIGNGTPAGRNVISGNNFGIAGSDFNGGLIRGNYIGTNAAGTAAIVNGFGGGNNFNAGVQVAGDNWLIEGNLASGNGTAISIVNGNQDTVRGNIVGLNAAGTAAIPNTFGILLSNGARNTIIGGTIPAQRNVISGNLGYGVNLWNLNLASSGNRIIGNYVGTNAAGTAGVPNGTGGTWTDGIYIEDAPNNFVGGLLAGEGNLIAFNTGRGVAISYGISAPTTGVRVLGNSIHSNGGIGIDLRPADGVTANDALDGDAGANNLQNFPVITLATTTSINGSLDSTADTTFTIQLFQNATCDASGNGEGQTLIATLPVTTDGTGSVIFAQGGLSLTSGQFVTATATDPGGSTSEFGFCVAIP